MIYILFVEYQNKFALPKDFLSLDRSAFQPIVFDNSPDAEIRSLNENYCKQTGVLYLTEKKNVGLSRAYNHVIDTYVSEQDYLLTLDQDTSIQKVYLDQLKESIDVSHKDVYSPINISEKTNEIDSPLKIVFKPLFLSKRVDLTVDSEDYFKLINNGICLSGKALKKIGGYDPNIFLYFSDSYLSFMLWKNKIKTTVLPYRNICDFSIEHLPHEKLLPRLRMMKRDGHYFYRRIYREVHRPLFAPIHYQLFCLKEAKMCSQATSKKYFFHYLFSGREKS